MAAPLRRLARHSLGVRVHARPQRVAFLFDPNSFSAAELSTVVSTSTMSWGGRFHALIPTDGQKVRGEWVDLLVACDPDTIVAKGISDGLRDWLLETVCPSRIICGSSSEALRVHRHSINSVPVVPIPTYFTERYRGVDQLRFLNLQNGAGGTSPIELCLRLNLGTTEGTVFGDAAFKGLTCTTKALSEGTAASVVAAFAERRERLITPMDLCQAFCPAAEAPFDPQVRAFALVVGSSPMDQLFSWNHGAIRSASMHRFDGPWTGLADRSVSLAWIPEELIEDERAITLMAFILERRYWSNASHIDLECVSYSVAPERIRRLAHAVAAVVPKWKNVIVGNPVLLQPDQARLPRKWGTARPDRPFDRRYALDRGLTLDAPLPPFEDQPATDAIWAVDVDIELPSENHVQRAPESWRLPKRPELPSLFVQTRDHRARVAQGGGLSVLVGGRDRVVNVRIPEPRRLFEAMLTRQLRYGRQSYPDLTPREIDYARLSAEGKRLRGLVGLMDGVAAAASLLEDEFWRGVLLEMAGAGGEQSPFDAAVTILKRSVGEGKLAEAEGTASVAEEMVRQVGAKSRAPRQLTWKLIKQRMTDFHGRARTRAGESWGSQQEFVDDERRRFLELVRKDVLLQGMELACPECGRRQWISVSAIDLMLRCEGCQRTFRIPTEDQPWSFRLNELMAGALRDKGVINVLRTMNAIDSGGTAVFCPSLDVFLRGQQSALTDLDVLALYDGKFLIGEVKSSPQGFKPKDFDDLARVAEIVRPDEVLIAAPVDPADAWARVLTNAKSLATRLRPMGVSVVSIGLDWERWSRPEVVAPD